MKGFPLVPADLFTFLASRRYLVKGHRVGVDADDVTAAASVQRAAPLPSSMTIRLTDGTTEALIVRQSNIFTLCYSKCLCSKQLAAWLPNKPSSLASQSRTKFNFVELVSSHSRRWCFFVLENAKQLIFRPTARFCRNRSQDGEPPQLPTVNY